MLTLYIFPCIMDKRSIVAELKTAYQLAQERIIVSTFAKELERKRAQERAAQQRDFEETPDMVLEWERQQREDENPFEKQKQKQKEEMNDKPSKLYTQEEIAAYRQGKRANVVAPPAPVEEDYLVPLVEPEPKTYVDVPEVHWYGHFTSYSGFSRMNRAMVFGLGNRGVRVKIDAEPCKIEINDATCKELDFHKSLEINDAAPKVYGATIPITMMHGGKKILYTMMETSETLHKNYVEKINLFDECWVPTHYGASMFKKNGVRCPIRVMPLGVDVERYCPTAEPYVFANPLNKFVFISVFKWGARKGYDMLLKAYFDEFSAEDDVSLLLVTKCETDNNPNRIAEDILAIRNGIDKSDEQLPHLAICGKAFPERDMPRLYTAANAFVLISLGEGFGLPYCEAAACGLPVIGSNCSGQSDYLKEDNSYLVNPESYAQVKVNGNMSKLAKHCGFYENQTFPVFSEAALQQTREYMRFVYENEYAAKKKGAKLTKLVRTEYSWEKAVDKVLQRVKELQV